MDGESTKLEKKWRLTPDTSRNVEVGHVYFTRAVLHVGGEGGECRELLILTGKYTRAEARDQRR